MKITLIKISLFLIIMIKNKTIEQDFHSINSKKYNSCKIFKFLRFMSKILSMNPSKTNNLHKDLLLTMKILTWTTNGNIF